MKTSYWRWQLMAALALNTATSFSAELTSSKAEMMGRVEDFFMHNFKDITAKKSMEWGEVTAQPDGSRSIRYQYEARIWDREGILANQVFTFDRTGRFVRFENVSGFPKKKEQKAADTTTKEGMIALVDDFFENNFRDVTARKTLEWGDVETAANGERSIRYRYQARIWNKETKILDQVFTFDPKGKFVSVKDAERQRNK